jgi:hypothetical protein
MNISINALRIVLSAGLVRDLKYFMYLACAAFFFSSSFSLAFLSFSVSSGSASGDSFFFSSSPNFAALGCLSSPCCASAFRFPSGAGGGASAAADFSLAGADAGAGAVAD